MPGCVFFFFAYCFSFRKDLYGATCCFDGEPEKFFRLVGEGDLTEIKQLEYPALAEVRSGCRRKKREKRQCCFSGIRLVRFFGMV